jgi:hypothetical protein
LAERPSQKRRSPSERRPEGAAAPRGRAREGARQPTERRISTPLVLAAASAMIAVAGVVLFGIGAGEEPAAPRGPRALTIDDSTPERAAESFYDAWRRRRWAQALEVSVGAAREDVLQKQARDAQLPREERVVAERMWDALARAPLTMALDEAEMLGGDRYVLRGTAEYDFVNRPYRRRVEMVVRPSPEGYRVAEMRLGEVLTELPPMFQGAAEEERP